MSFGVLVLLFVGLTLMFTRVGWLLIVTAAAGGAAFMVLAWTVGNWAPHWAAANLGALLLGSASVGLMAGTGFIEWLNRG